MNVIEFHNHSSKQTKCQLQILTLQSCYYGNISWSVSKLIQEMGKLDTQ